GVAIVPAHVRRSDLIADVDGELLRDGDAGRVVIVGGDVDGGSSGGVGHGGGARAEAERVDGGGGGAAGGEEHEHERGAPHCTPTPTARPVTKMVPPERTSRFKSWTCTKPSMRHGDAPQPAPSPKM